MKEVVFKGVYDNTEDRKEVMMRMGDICHSMLMKTKHDRYVMEVDTENEKYILKVSYISFE